MKCLKCKRWELLLIAGTFGHLLKKENQYYICEMCGEKFTRDLIEENIEKHIERNKRNAS